MAESLHFAESDAKKLEPHLPSEEGMRFAANSSRPFVTLTFATSLDSSLSLAPGTRTRLSGPESKAMTHFLRSRHDAICVGVGTVIADDPGLNCRIEHVGMAGQPRPIVIDPHGRWDFTAQSKVFEVARAGLGLAPFIVTSVTVPDVSKRAVLEEHGGKFIVLDLGPTRQAGTEDSVAPTETARFQWQAILSALHGEGLRSVMVEGGAQVINALLSPACRELVDSIIVTIAPTWLGQGGVVVSPDRVHGSDGVPVPAARLVEVSWHPFGEDIVLCGILSRDS